MLQDAQDLESEPEVKMDDIMSDDTLNSSPDPKGPIRKANSGTNRDEDHLIYDWERFRVDKACRVDISPTTTIARS